MKAAVEALIGKVLAVTITGELYSPGEAAEVASLACLLDVEHIIIEYSDLEEPAFGN